MSKSVRLPKDWRNTTLLYSNLLTREEAESQNSPESAWLHPSLTGSSLYWDGEESAYYFWKGNQRMSSKHLLDIRALEPLFPMPRWKRETLYEETHHFLKQAPVAERGGGFLNTTQEVQRGLWVCGFYVTWKCSRQRLPPGLAEESWASQTSPKNEQEDSRQILKELWETSAI